MRVEFVVEKPPKLWSFMRTHLPAALKAVKYSVSHGYYESEYGIKIKERSRTFNWLTTVVVARIGDDDEVHIFEPQWQLDIENLVEKYEALTGANILIKVHQSFADGQARMRQQSEKKPAKRAITFK